MDNSADTKGLIVQMVRAVAATGLDWFEIFIPLGFVLGEQKFVVEPLRLIDDGELVNCEFKSRAEKCIFQPPFLGTFYDDMMQVRLPLGV